MAALPRPGQAGPGIGHGPAPDGGDGSPRAALGARILWELRDEPLGARALRSRCDGMSSSVLYERLDELTGAGLITRDEAGDYLLTDLGAALGPALESLDSWARRWSETLHEAGRPG